MAAAWLMKPGGFSCQAAPRMQLWYSRYPLLSIAAGEVMAALLLPVAWSLHEVLLYQVPPRSKHSPWLWLNRPCL